jgi:hypothetical protein
MLRTNLRLFTALAVVLQACSSTGGNNPPGDGSTGSGGHSTGAGGAATAGAAGNAVGVSGSGPSESGGAPGSAGSTGSSAGSVGAAGTGTGNAGTGSGAAGGSGSVCSVSPSVSGLAFPEAEGFGQHATGGRAGTVYHVTNLNDSGAGSFRDAVSQSNRIVVFDVGGYISLLTAVSVKSNITIAGQTAPGQGIGFRGGEISFANSSNIICRYIRVRPGDETASTTDDALSLFRAKNAIVDHSSFEFAPWNNIDAVSDDWQNFPVTDITFQDNLIADPTGQQFGAHTESVSSQWAWYRNIFANSHNRNPLAKINDIFANNVLYNYSAGYTTHTSTQFKHDIINNYFIFGPASTGTDNTWFQVDLNQSIYYAGNLKDTNLNGTLDGATTTPFWYQGTGTILSAPWSSPTLAASVHAAPSAYRIAVSLAGTLPRDPMDALIISQIASLGKAATGTGAGTAGPDGGLYTSQTQTGLSNNGYGAISGGTKATDTDNDGMPDFWEHATGSDPAADDAMDKAPDGYALVERYLNWLAEPHATSAGGAAVDIDLSSLTLGFSEMTPTFTVTQPGCGSVALTGGHTAHFTPAAGFAYVSSFDFTVTGSDKTTYTGRVAVLVGP